MALASSTGRVARLSGSCTRRGAAQALKPARRASVARQQRLQVQVCLQPPLPLGAFHAGLVGLMQ